jgi:hypothetical protein
MLAKVELFCPESDFGLPGSFPIRGRSMQLLKDLSATSAEQKAHCGAQLIKLTC